MPLPTWIVGIRDPAYAYMLRSSGARRPRTRLFARRGSRQVGIGYVPAGSSRSERRAQPTAAEIDELRARAEESMGSSTARLREVEERHGEALRAVAAELGRRGTATLRTTAGDIAARIVPFRKDAVVLEVFGPGSAVGRSRLTRATVEEQAVHQLAFAVAEGPPRTEPLSR